MRVKAILPLLLAFIALPALSGEAAITMYLEVAGVEGEATETNHKDWIEVLSYSWSAVQPTSHRSAMGGGGQPEGVVLRDFECVKPLDKSTPKLMESCCNGVLIPMVTLEVVRHVGESPTILKYTLEGVIVTSVTDSANTGDEMPRQEVTFTFRKLTCTYTETDGDGTTQGDVEFSYDQDSDQS